MKVKICGVTSPEDAAMCEDLGADALGFVHVPGRGRSRPLGQISDMCNSVGPLTQTFLICSPADVREALAMLEKSGAGGLQLYSLGPEEVEELRDSGVTVFRAVSPDRAEAARFAHSADAIVFEVGTPGTGAAYDYSKTPIDSCPRSIIAGGLTIDTLDLAKRLGPYGLDVSSGVERVPGRKDPELVREFIRRCKE